MNKSIVFLTVSMIGCVTPLAIAQDEADACAEVTLRYDTELMATPADQLERPLTHETQLNDLHVRKLERAIRDCGSTDGIWISGVSTNGPNSLSGPVVQRQMAARRISAFSTWAAEQGIPRKNLKLGSNGAIEPWPAALVLEFSFEEPAEIVLLKPEPAPQLVPRTGRNVGKVATTNTAETEVTATANTEPLAEPIAPEAESPIVVTEQPAPPPAVELGPCETPFVVTFGSDYSKNESVEGLKAHLEECSDVPNFAMTVAFEELNISNYAAWLAWNVALSSELRPIATGN